MLWPWETRPVPIVKEDPGHPGLYELWFGKWLLTGGTDRERLEDLAAKMRL